MSNIPSHTICWLALAMASCIAAQGTQDTAAKVGELNREAQQYLQERKPELAIPLLHQILMLDPNNLNAHANLGVLLFFQNDYANAIPELRAAMEAQPDLWKIEALLGIAEKRTGAPADAQNNLEHAFPKLDEKGIQVQAGMELIELDVGLGQFGKAAAVVETLESVSPQDPQILMAAYQISLQITDQSLLSMVMVAPDSAQMHMMMANKFGRDGDRANAIAEYRAAIRLSPQLPGAHFELAEQLRNTDNPAVKAHAAEEYKAALGVNEFDERAWRGLGELMAERGDYKSAKQDYEKALALQPRDADAETDLAITLMAVNRSDKALPLLESAIGDDPTNVIAHFRLSTIYRQMGKTADSEHEMEVFRHYKAMKDKLGKTFQQMRTQSASQ
jgi:tetratricopeptide (TPR) repeat protein